MAFLGNNRHIHALTADTSAVNPRSTRLLRKVIDDHAGLKVIRCINDGIRLFDQRSECFNCAVCNICTKLNTAVDLGKTFFAAAAFGSLSSASFSV